MRSRFRSVGYRFLLMVLVLALLVGLWELSSLFRLSTFDVSSTVKAPHTGITQIITGDGGSSSSTVSKKGGADSTAPFTGGADGGDSPQGDDVPDATSPHNGGGSGAGMVEIGEQGNLISINTPIAYGTVFPEEVLTDSFTVHLNATEDVTYTVNITANTTGGFKDMRPHLIVYKDAGESEVEPDATANGTAGDWYASGNLTYGSDTQDKWWVTFIVPDELGDYQADIYVVPKAKTTVD